MCFSLLLHFFYKLLRATWRSNNIYKFPDRLVMLFDYSAARAQITLCAFACMCALSLLPHADELAARKDDKLLAFHLVITLSCNVCLIILLACFLFYCDSSPAQTK